MRFDAMLLSAFMRYAAFCYDAMMFMPRHAAIAAIID